MSLKRISIITFVLFVVSIFVHLNEHKRSSNLNMGSYFIKGLDINSVRKISIQFEKDQPIVLSKEGAIFVLSSHKSYPASTSKVNDLVYKIASIQIKEKSKSQASEKALAGFGLAKDSMKYKIEIFDNEGKKTQSFFIGKSHKNKGNYLGKEGSGDVYLSSSAVWFNSSYQSFINTKLFNIKSEDIVKVSVQGRKPFELKINDKEYTLTNSKNEIKKESVKSYLSDFEKMRFEEYFSANEEVVNEIQFNQNIKIELKNNLVYDVKLGQKQPGDYYLKASAITPQIPSKIVVKENSSTEDLKNVEEMVQAKQKAEIFNMEKGVWVYKLSKDNYEKITKEASDLM